MLDGFSAHTHGLRVFIETALDVFENVFVFPSGDRTLIGGRAALLQPAEGACSRRVAPLLKALSLPFVRDELQHLARRADVRVVPCNVAKVGLPEHAPRPIVRRLRLRHRHRDIGFSAFQDLLARVIAAVGDDIELIDVEYLLGEL